MFFDRMAIVLVMLACKPPESADTMDGESSESDTGTTVDGGTTVEMSTTLDSSDMTSSGESESSTGGSESTSESTGDPMSGMCNIWMDDCSEGQKCAPVDTAMPLDGFANSTECVPVDANPKEVGEPCTKSDGGRIDNCRRGAECKVRYYDMVETGTGEGLCVALCEGSPMDARCDDGRVCGIWNGGSEPWCIEQCNILAQDCTADGWMCSYAGLAAESAGCVLDESGPTGAYADPCACEPGCCDEGLICILGNALANCPEPGAVGCCTEYCDVNAENTCSGMPEGEECVSSTELIGAVPGLEEVGICILPP